MRRWALIQGGVVAAITTQAEQPSLPGVWVDTASHTVALGALYAGGSFTPAAVDRHITNYALKARMSSAERVGVRTAAQSSPEVADFLDLADSAEYIDLDDQRTITGLQALEAAGLLAAGRSLAILNAPIAAHERPAV